MPITTGSLEKYLESGEVKLIENAKALVASANNREEAAKNMQAISVVINRIHDLTKVVTTTKWMLISSGIRNAILPTVGAYVGAPPLPILAAKCLSSVGATFGFLRAPIVKPVVTGRLAELGKLKEEAIQKLKQFDEANTFSTEQRVSSLRRRMNAGDA